MNVSTKLLKAIQTTNADGVGNGWVLPIWNSAFDKKYKPKQVYLCVVAGGMDKGPHLHMLRAGAFTCMRGVVLIVTRTKDGEYREQLCGQGYFKTVTVPAGVPAALYNVGAEDAYVLNMPDHPRVDNSDDHTPDAWTYDPFTWRPR